MALLDEPERSVPVRSVLRCLQNSGSALVREKLSQKRLDHRKFVWFVPAADVPYGVLRLASSIHFPEGFSIKVYLFRLVGLICPIAWFVPQERSPTAANGDVSLTLKTTDSAFQDHT